MSIQFKNRTLKTLNKKKVITGITLGSADTLLY